MAECVIPDMTARDSRAERASCASEAQAGAASPILAAELPELSAQQADELRRLGPLQQIYTSDPTSRRKNAWLLWLGIAVGLLALAPGIMAIVTGEVATHGKAAIAGLCLAAVFLPWCAWRLRQVAGGKHIRILVCRDGLARVDGDNVITCRWDEIESVQGIVKTYRLEHVPVASRFMVTVQFGGGKQLRIDAAREHLQGMPALFQRLAEESSRHLFPRLRADIEAGLTVPFGVLALSKQGLHWGRHVLTWEDRDNLDYHDGWRIRNPTTWPLHPWVRLADFAIPNHLVFLRLVDHCAQAGRSTKLNNSEGRQVD